jgi:DNA-directed RNA polymerase subunit RPC12/RpoP
MSNLTNAVCFTCGLVIESPPRLSRLTTGQACPACRDRVLEGLPPALPSRRASAALEGDLQPGSGGGSASDDPDSGSGPGDWDRAS